MSRNDTRNTADLLGVALTGLLVTGSAFAVQPLTQGYLIAAAGPAAAEKAKGAEGKCGEESFARTDTNHDGKVSREEFNVAAPTRIAEFDKIDTDHDGVISLPEALESVKASRKAAGKEVGEGKCGEGKCGEG